MNNFTFRLPTEIHFGKGTENEVGALVRARGCKKVLVHYGSGSAKRSGLLDKVFAALDAEGINYISLGGVVPNPRLSLVYEGIRLCREEGVDFILAVGGGSVIDSAKGIGYGVANPDCDVWEFYEKKKVPKATLPVGVILTIAAAGSETSNSSVLTKEDGWLKRGAQNEISRPVFAIMDPELTYTLPKYQTASGSVDIMMHTLERYFQPGIMSITMALGEALLRTMLHYAPIAYKEPENYEARAEIMWCGSLSHNSMMELGGTRGDWSCHQLEHELGGMFDVAHGAGLAAVWPTWARYVWKAMPDRFYTFATRVMGVADQGDEEATILAGIDAFEAFLKSIGMPTRIRELGIDPTEEQVAELALKCSHWHGRSIGTDGVMPLPYDDILKIYQLAL